MIPSMEMSAREVLVSGQEDRDKLILTLVYFTYKNLLVTFSSSFVEHL